MNEIKVDDYSILKDRFYMKSHEWIKDLGAGIWSMGISDYAQKMLHEISYVQFEELGEEFDSKDIIVVVEALKATGDIYAPFKCELLENNLGLEDNPEIISESPYNKGFLVKIKALSDDRSNLITAEEYAKVIEEELEDL